MDAAQAGGGGGGARWQVTGQQETTQFDAGNKLVPGVTVMFQTAMGHTGTVFVPSVQYTPDRVRQLVGERAALMDEVGSLTSPG